MADIVLTREASFSSSDHYFTFDDVAGCMEVFCTCALQPLGDQPLHHDKLKPKNLPIGFLLLQHTASRSKLSFKALFAKGTMDGFL